MPLPDTVVWSCQKCGACCEILPPLFFGQPCPHYDKPNKLCLVYETRPEICRVKHLFGEEVTQMYCEKLRKLREGN